MSEVEQLRQEVAAIAGQLVEQAKASERAHEALKGAYLVLLRHLSARGYADLSIVQQDLETMAEAQESAIWQSEYSALAGAVRLVGALPSVQQ